MHAALSIIILNYNTKDLTIKCLESIIKNYKEQLEKEEFEIIVVDNDSKDGSAELIEEKFMSRHSGNQSVDRRTEHPESPTAVRDAGQAVRRPEPIRPELTASRRLTAEWASMTKNGNFILIKNNENFGFAKGCNVGAKVAKGKYILFLNSDTQVLDKGFLKMMEFLEQNKQIGILGGRLLNSDLSAQPSAGKFYTMFNFLLLLIGGERFGWLRSSPEKITNVDWVSGACFMISRKLFDRLKGFDEHFFMYMEDMELCFRAKHFGFPTYFLPDIKIIHKSLGSSTREFAVRNIDKGILYFYKKHKAYWQYLLVKTLLMLKGVIKT